MDLSQAKVVEAILTITAAASVVGSTLGVKLQMATYMDPAGNVVWDTRGYFNLVPGNQPASVASPYQQGLNVSQDVDLTTSERTYTPTGSNGGTELTPGTVRDGNFPSFLRGHGGLEGTGGRTSGCRISLVQTDSANSAAFVGRVDVFAHCWDQ